MQVDCWEMEDTSGSPLNRPKRFERKVIYTLNIDYAKEITDLTYPLLEQYADKIGADFRVIRQRAFPSWPLDYEKLQIHKLGRENDWNIYIDSDALVHPDYFDLTNFIHKDTVLHNGADMANMRFRYDHYFRRDGRNIGSCNWFTIGSDWCIDLWHPLEDLTLEQAIGNIYPIHKELISTGRCQKAAHLISDYTLSRNIAKYGLKFTTAGQVLEKIGQPGEFLHHSYQIGLQEKIRELRQVLKNWEMPPFWNLAEADISRAAAIPGWMTENELAWLALQARDFRRIVEIGSHLGRSTRALAENTQGFVYCIDDWKGARDAENKVEPAQIFQEFQKNLYGLDNVRIQRMDYATLPNLNLDFRPDMIFLDGDHRYESVVRDLLWATRAMQYGMLCGHDASYPEVQQALKSVLPAAHINRFSEGDIWWVPLNGV